MMVLSSTDLPVPEGPSITRISPAGIVSETSPQISCLPKPQRGDVRPGVGLEVVEHVVPDRRHRAGDRGALAGDEADQRLRLEEPVRHDQIRSSDQRCVDQTPGVGRSEEHTSELQSLMRISYAVFCLKKKKQT